MLQCQCDDQVFVGPSNRMRGEDDTAIFLCCERQNRARDFGRIVDAAGRDLDTKARRRCLKGAPKRLMDGRLGMHDHHDAIDLRRCLFQHLQPLTTNRAISAGEAGNVPSGMSEARNEPIANGIANSNEHYWNGVCCRLEQRHRGIAESHNHFGRQRKKLGNN